MAGVLLIFGACTLWALDTLIRYPLLFSGVSPWAIVWIEHLFLVLVMAWAVRGLWSRRPFDRQTLIGFLVIGGLGSALSTVAFTNAFSLINPSVVILIQKLQPLVAVSLAGWLLHERVDAHFLRWMGVCLVGSFLIASNDLLPVLDPASWGGEESLKVLLGYGCTLLAVIGWGAATVFGKRLANQGYSTTELMAGRFLTGFIILTPFVFLFSSPAVVGNLDISSKVAMMVAISGLGGMALYYLGMQRLPARTCAMAEMFFPVAAVIINWVFLDQALSGIQLIGAALLLFGSMRVALSYHAQPVEAVGDLSRSSA